MADLSLPSDSKHPAGAIPAGCLCFEGAATAAGRMIVFCRPGPFVWDFPCPSAAFPDLAWRRLGGVGRANRVSNLATDLNQL